MKIKKQLSFYITIAVILSILYIIFSIQPIGKEFQFTPEWKIDVSNPTIKENKNNSSVNYFKLSQTAGYFTSDGEVTNFITFHIKHQFQIITTLHTIQITLQQIFSLRKEQKKAQSRSQVSL